MLLHWWLPERSPCRAIYSADGFESEKSVHYLGCWIRAAQAGRSWVPVLQDRKKPQFVKSSSYQMEQGRLYVMACREDNWKLQPPAGLGSAESFMRSGESAIQGIFLCSPMQKFPGLFPYLFLHIKNPNIPAETFKVSRQYFWHSNMAITHHAGSSFSAGRTFTLTVVENFCLN